MLSHRQKQKVLREEAIKQTEKLTDVFNAVKCLHQLSCKILKRDSRVVNGVLSVNVTFGAKQHFCKVDLVKLALLLPRHLIGWVSAKDPCRWKSELSISPLLFVSQSDHLQQGLATLALLCQLASSNAKLAKELGRCESWMGEVTDLCLLTLLRCNANDTASNHPQESATDAASCSDPTVAWLPGVQEQCQLAERALGLMWAVCGESPVTAASNVICHEKTGLLVCTALDAAFFCCSSLASAIKAMLLRPAPHHLNTLVEEPRLGARVAALRGQWKEACFACQHIINHLIAFIIPVVCCHFGSLPSSTTTLLPTDAGAPSTTKAGPGRKKKKSDNGGSVAAALAPEVLLSALRAVKAAVVITASALPTQSEQKECPHVLELSTYLQTCIIAPGMALWHSLCLAGEALTDDSPWLLDLIHSHPQCRHLADQITHQVVDLTKTVLDPPSSPPPPHLPSSEPSLPTEQNDSNSQVEGGEGADMCGQDSWNASESHNGGIRKMNDTSSRHHTKHQAQGGGMSPAVEHQLLRTLGDFLAEDNHFGVQVKNLTDSLVKVISLPCEDFQSLWCGGEGVCERYMAQSRAQLDDPRLNLWPVGTFGKTSTPDQPSLSTPATVSYEQQAVKERAVSFYKLLSALLVEKVGKKVPFLARAEAILKTCGDFREVSSIANQNLKALQKYVKLHGEKDRISPAEDELVNEAVEFFDSCSMSRH